MHTRSSSRLNLLDAGKIVETVLRRNAELGDIYGRRAQSLDPGDQRAKSIDEICGRFTRALARVFEPITFIYETDDSYIRMQLLHAVEEFTGELGRTTDTIAAARNGGGRKPQLDKLYASASKTAAALPAYMRAALVTRIIDQHVSGLLPDELSALTGWLNSTALSDAAPPDQRAILSYSGFADAFRTAVVKTNSGRLARAAMREVVPGAVTSSGPSEATGLSKARSTVPVESMAHLISQEISKLSAAYDGDNADSAVKEISTAWKARIADLSPPEVEKLLTGLSESAAKLRAGSPLSKPYAILKKAAAEKHLSVHVDAFANGLRSGLSPKENAQLLNRLESTAKRFDALDIRDVKDRPVMAIEVFQRGFLKEIEGMTQSRLMGGLEALDHNGSARGNMGAAAPAPDRVDRPGLNRRQAARAGLTPGQVAGAAIRRQLETRATDVFDRHISGLDRIFGLDPVNSNRDSTRAVQRMFKFAENLGESASLESRIGEIVGYESEATLRHQLGQLHLTEFFDTTPIDTYCWLKEIYYQLKIAPAPKAKPVTESELAVSRTHHALAVMLQTFMGQFAKKDPGLEIRATGRRIHREDLRDALEIQFSKL